MLGLWQANGRGKGEGDGSNFMKMVLALQVTFLADRRGAEIQWSSFFGACRESRSAPETGVNGSR